MTLALQTRAVQTSIARAADRDDWTSFVNGSPDAQFFHDWRWGEVVGRAYGHAQIYLIARRGGRVVGVLPLIDVKSPFLGRALISTAFTVGGGILTDDEEAAGALAAQAIAEGEARGVRYVELRAVPRAPLSGDQSGDQTRNQTRNQAGGWVVKDGVYETYARNLPTNADDIPAMVPRKRRAEVRKSLALAEKGALRIRHDASVEEFHRLYAVSVRNLGTPVFGRRFIRHLKETFAEEAVFSVVESEGAPVMSLCSFVFRDTLVPYYAGLGPRARACRAGDFAYYSLMREARVRGLARFDFGRSKTGSPHAAYKRSWGFEPEPLDYAYALLGARATPNVNPENPKFSLLSNAWRRLPLWAANAIGPTLARSLA